jgi:hypothetical protein
MFYRDINVLLLRTSSIDDVFSSFARDFNLDTSKIIRILVTSLKERRIRNESVKNKCRENIENNIENNEISESDENERNYKNERSHRSHRDSESVRNRNEDNWVNWNIEQRITMTRRTLNARRIIWLNVARRSSLTISTRDKCHLQSLIRSFERVCFEGNQRWLKKKRKKT